MRSTFSGAWREAAVIGVLTLMLFIGGAVALEEDEVVVGPSAAVLAADDATATPTCGPGSPVPDPAAPRAHRSASQ